MAWFTRDKSGLKPEEGERRVRTEGLWLKCEHCGQIIWRKALEDNLQVCPKCEHHERIGRARPSGDAVRRRQFEEFDQQLVSTDPLEFRRFRKPTRSGWRLRRKPRSFATPSFPAAAI